MVYKFLRSLLFIAAFLTIPKTNAQSMKAIDILSNLKPYTNLLNEILTCEKPILQNKKDFTTTSVCVRSQYGFITLELHYLSTNTNNQAKATKTLYCEIKFEKTLENKMVVSSLYCEDNSRTKTIEKLIKNDTIITTVLWEEKPKTDFYLNKEITQYILIADSIANLSQNCASGDNYQPGNFSEISIDNEFIILSQVNHMNAKSLKHKNNYSIRNLVFTIPLTDKGKKISFFDQQIGSMVVEFSDNSSENNKPCGNAIKEKIKQEIIAFQQK